MTINEIAALSGVSRATVSRYLNHGYVSGEKKERIKKVIEETGYQPSTQAQMLRAKKTSCIAVLISDIAATKSSRMLHGISEVLMNKGYQCLLYNTENNSKKECEYLRQLTTNRIDGIIFIGTPFSKEHHKIMKGNSVPFVVLGQQVKEYSCVFADEYGAAKELTKSALQKGYNHAFLGSFLEEDVSERERLYGFLDAHFDIDHTIEDYQCMKVDASFQGGFDGAKELLKNFTEIDTIVCAFDELAAGVIAYLNEIHKMIPKEIQVLSFGDDVISKVTTPTITTVHFYNKTSGIEAANILMNIIENNFTIRKEMKMGYQIIKRDSFDF